MITKATASSLGLVPTGTTIIRHARGSSTSNTYVVNLGLPNHVQIIGASVAECDDCDHFGAIIGMDIITTGDFAITNKGGRTCMSFRMPSIQTVDYVDDWRKHQFDGIGRNDPCPCRSGKKFKRCHGKDA